MGSYNDSTLSRQAKGLNPKDYILIKDRDSNLYSAKNRILQNHDWEQQIRKLARRKGDMCEIRDFLDLRDLLDSRKRAYDGKGSLVSTLEKQGLLDEMIDRRTPWRAEYFGNRFFKYINEDGLVTKLRGKEIFYFSPIDGRVARFVAGEK